MQVVKKVFMHPGDHRRTAAMIEAEMMSVDANRSFNRRSSS
jgi:hypothetical protein